jgi:hypothetical protein
MVYGMVWYGMVSKYFLINFYLFIICPFINFKAPYYIKYKKDKNINYMYACG